MQYSVMVAALLSTVLAASGQGADATATEPLTRLPLPTAADSFQVKDPMNVGEFPVCKSTGNMNMYTQVSGAVDAAIAWYTAHLPGFQHVHGFGSGRSQDTFFNAPGTLVVSITGMPAAQGQNTHVYSIIYGKIQPGVSRQVIAGMNIQKVVCP